MYRAGKRSVQLIQYITQNVNLYNMWPKYYSKILILISFLINKLQGPD